MVASKFIKRKLQVDKRVKYCELNETAESKQTTLTAMALKAFFFFLIPSKAGKDKQQQLKRTAGVKDVTKHGGHIHSLVEEPVLFEAQGRALERERRGR